MLWPLIQMSIRRSPQIMLPVAIVIGFVGYKLEGWMSSKYTPATDPIKEQRNERLLENIDNLAAEVTQKPKHNPLEVNLSPSLS